MNMKQILAFSVCATFTLSNLGYAGHQSTSQAPTSVQEATENTENSTKDKQSSSKKPATRTWWGGWATLAGASLLGSLMAYRFLGGSSAQPKTYKPTVPTKDEVERFKELTTPIMHPLSPNYKNLKEFVDKNLCAGIGQIGVFSQDEIKKVSVEYRHRDSQAFIKLIYALEDYHIQHHAFKINDITYPSELFINDACRQLDQEIRALAEQYPNLWTDYREFVQAYSPEKGYLSADILHQKISGLNLPQDIKEKILEPLYTLRGKLSPKQLEQRRKEDEERTQIEKTRQQTISKLIDTNTKQPLITHYALDNPFYSTSLFDADKPFLSVIEDYRKLNPKLPIVTHQDCKRLLETCLSNLRNNSLELVRPQTISLDLTYKTLKQNYTSFRDAHQNAGQFGQYDLTSHVWTRFKLHPLMQQFEKDNPALSTLLPEQLVSEIINPMKNIEKTLEEMEKKEDQLHSSLHLPQGTNQLIESLTQAYPPIPFDQRRHVIGFIEKLTEEASHIRGLSLEGLSIHAIPEFNTHGIKSKILPICYHVSGFKFSMPDLNPFPSKIKKHLEFLPLFANAELYKNTNWNFYTFGLEKLAKDTHLSQEDMNKLYQMFRKSFGQLTQLHLDAKHITAQDTLAPNMKFSQALSTTLSLELPEAK